MLIVFVQEYYYTLCLLTCQFFYRNKVILFSQDNTSVMSKVTATLGRNFIKTKEFQEAQLMGMDAVSRNFHCT